MIVASRRRIDVRRELGSVGLADVQAAFDPLTKARLESAGVGAGWRCLVVGTGRGSIAAWLRSLVAPAGEVVAVDDVQCDVEPGGFDLAHSRHVLMTAADPAAALDRMVGALRPGGRLVVEEGDFDEPRVVTREHPAAGAFERVWHATTAFLSESMDVRLGARLPRAGLALGLDDYHVECTHTYSPGGDPGPMAMRIAVEMFRDRLLEATALWEDDLDLATAALEDPSFVCAGPTSYAIFGRRRA
jgi:SAM-dependent methyltransferase